MGNSCYHLVQNCSGLVFNHVNTTKWLWLLKEIILVGLLMRQSVLNNSLKNHENIIQSDYFWIIKKHLTVRLDIMRDKIISNFK